MENNQRERPRFNPQGLDAVISISPPQPAEVINLVGNVVDMSYSGIKIKLHEAMPVDIPKSKIEINIKMPESNVPITIKGIIKHLNDDSECGVKYSNEHSEDKVDDLMFECIKCSDESSMQQVFNLL